MVMKQQKPSLDFEFSRILLLNAKMHLKLVLGLTATRRHVNYLETFSFGQHVAHRDELALTTEQEEHAFAALEHCAPYLAAVQVHTILESIHTDPFKISESEIAAAFQIARLIRNAFARNPFEPIWEIRDTGKDHTFSVPSVITLNTTQANAHLISHTVTPFSSNYCVPRLFH
jgi:hypothetical protein